MLSKTDWAWSTSYPAHICNDLSLFYDIRNNHGLIRPTVKVTPPAADDRRIRSPAAIASSQGLHGYPYYAVGSVDVVVNTRHGKSTRRLDHVLFVPTAAYSIFSATFEARPASRELASSGGQYSVVQQRGQPGKQFYRSIFKQPAPGASYEILDGGSAPPRNAAGDPDHDWMVWHCRLGHVKRDRLIETLKQGGIDMPTKCPDPLPFCQGCHDAKHETAVGVANRAINTRDQLSDEPFRYEAYKNQPTGTEKPLDIVLADITGPYRPASLNGKRYLLLILDVHTRYIWVYPIQRTADAHGTFAQWHDRVTGHPFGGASGSGTASRHIGILRSEREGEFLSVGFKQMCADRGIKQQTYVPGELHTEALGIIKIAIRHLQEMMNSMLLHLRLRPALWSEAAIYAAWIRNRLPTQALQGQSPFRRRHGDNPKDLPRAAVFGARVWPKASVFDEDDKRGVSRLPRDGSIHFMRPCRIDSMMVKHVNSNKIVEVGRDEVEFVHEAVVSA